MNIRPEIPADILSIREVNRHAFGREDEGRLIDALRQRRAIICSLVVEADGRIAGHALFTPAVLDDDGRVTQVAALGPVAVLPEFQLRGFGQALIEAGLAICRARGYGLCVVLGHPGYYPRFGFRPSAPLGISWEHDAPAEAFMVLELRPGTLAGARGLIRYLPEFDGV